MAKNTNPVFGLNGFFDMSSVDVANAAGDGSGTINLLSTGDVNGKRINSIQAAIAQASVTTNSAMVLRFFLSSDSGTTYFKYREIAFPAVAGSNTAIGQFQEIQIPAGLFLEGSTQRLGWTKSIHAGAQDKVHAMAIGTIQGS